MVVSQPPRRSNAPHRRYRGFSHTVWAHTSCGKLWVRHSQRRARARPSSPPSRAPRRGCPMWRFHSHRGVPTRPTVINAASQALYGVIQPLSSSVSGILNVGRTQAPISPPSRAHRRGCPMLCFHSDRGVQTSLSVDTAASQALCWTIQSRPSSGSGIFSVGRHARPISPPTSPHRRGCPLLADSPPWRRENEPHCRYRGFSNTL